MAKENEDFSDIPTKFIFVIFRVNRCRGGPVRSARGEVWGIATRLVEEDINMLAKFIAVRSSTRSHWTFWATVNC